jgi:cytochrome c oxidase subunit 4
MTDTNPTQTAAHTYPTPRVYVKIAVLLAVMTAVEVGLYYLEPVFGGLVIPFLIILSALKFLIVIGYYMHLRYEPATLSRFFAFGFVLALSLYAIVLIVFGVLALTIG